MIDAYEIGIQLLLQDDVSAGLVIINRELAEVDRAIAATSANLAGLVVEAERATKAVAKANTMTSGGAATTSSEKAGIPSAPDNRLSKAPTSERGGVASEGPGRLVATEPTPTAMVKPAAPSGLEQAKQVQAVKAISALSAAPTKEPAVTGADPILRPRQVPDELSKAAGVPKADRDAASPVVAKVAPTGGSAISRILGSMPPASVPTRVAVSASVNRVRTQVETDGQTPPFQRSSNAHVQGGREQTTAPWPQVHSNHVRTEPAKFRERASAPPAQERDRSGGSGGTVMLDGRLVGQWLSDHMGREASRPPAGTNFFDPRQTPAWNVSGAL